MKSRTKN